MTKAPPSFKIILRSHALSLVLKYRLIKARARLELLLDFGAELRLVLLLVFNSLYVGLVSCVFILLFGGGGGPIFRPLASNPGHIWG